MPPQSEQVRSYDTSQPFLGRILAAVERTRQIESPYIRYNPDGSYRELWDGPKRDSSDTIGTKAHLHWRAGTLEAGAQDAFAMNANDLYRDRAIPYKLVNTLMIEAEHNNAIARIVEQLSALSMDRGVQMGDGETAILDTVDGFELDVAMTGAVVDETPNRYQAGDVLIGIPSGGLHSNGYTDARRLFGDDCPPELLAPTRIYDEVPGLIRDHEIHGLTHVTGGGLSKLRTVGLGIHITKTHLTPSSEVFHDLFNRWFATTELRGGDSEHDFVLSTKLRAAREVYLKFNNGVGFILGVSPEDADALLAAIPDGEVIGEIEQKTVAGNGSMTIHNSPYVDRTVML